MSQTEQFAPSDPRTQLILDFRRKLLADFLEHGRAFLKATSEKKIQQPQPEKAQQ